MSGAHFAISNVKTKKRLTACMCVTFEKKPWLPIQHTPIHKYYDILILLIYINVQLLKYIRETMCFDFIEKKLVFFIFVNSSRTNSLKMNERNVFEKKTNGI
jgi:hypothetical protein